MYGEFSGSSSSEIRRRGGHAPFEQQQKTFRVSPVPSPVQGLDSSEPIKMASNAGRDRTSDFAATVKSLSMRNLNGHHVTGTGARSKNEVLAQQNKEFMKIAASIGQDIANTYTKLEALTLLAKKRTLFDDKPPLQPF